MNSKSITLSLLSAALAIMFVSSYIEGLEDQSKRKFGSEVLVAVAKEDIKEMDTVTEGQIELKPVPKSFLEPSAVSFENVQEPDAHLKEATKKLVGSIAIVPIKKGEQIAYNKITEPSIRTGLSPQIAPGKRAVSIGISEISGVSKLIKPGDRVDVITVVSIGAKKEEKMAKTILQDVVVLAVGKYVTNNSPRLIEMDGNKAKVKNLTSFEGFNTITLEVDPQQAQTVVLVNSMSDNQVHLVLRNNDDVDRNMLTPVSFTNLISGGDGRMPASGNQGGLK